MIRLLCIVSSLDAGGAETFLMKIYKQIDRNHHQMDFIVTENTNGIYEGEVRKLGGKIFEIPLRTKKPVKSFLKIKNIVKRNQYKYVLKLADTPVAITDIIAARIGGAEKISVRSCNAATLGSRYELIIYDLLRPLFVSSIDQMLAPSRNAAKFTFGRAGDDARILHNALDLSEYSYQEDKAADLKRKLGIEGKLIIGHIGRFHEQKNHKFLLDIFKEILVIDPNSVLLLVGEGKKGDEIRRYAAKDHIADKIIFLGVTKDVDVILSAFDVFVFPSLFEGLPNVIIEAQSVGVHCLISNTITKEVRITPLVHFMPLDKAAAEWADRAVHLAEKSVDRVKCREMLRESGYDIRNEVRHFISLTTK